MSGVTGDTGVASVVGVAVASPTLSVGVGVGVGTRATKTTEASIFIDLVDAKKQRVSWQGVAVVDVTDKVAQKLRDSVFTAVNVVFDQYPHKAGN